jgi:hypothetical protein
MEVDDANFNEIELGFLKNLVNWQRWEQAIRKAPLENPKVSRIYPASSGNLIHYTDNEGQFEEKEGIKVDD